MAVSCINMILSILSITTIYIAVGGRVKRGQQCIFTLKRQGARKGLQTRPWGDRPFGLIDLLFLNNPKNIIASNLNYQHGSYFAYVIIH